MKKKKNIAVIGYGRFGRLFAEIISGLGTVHIVSRQSGRSRPPLKPGREYIRYQDLREMDLVVPAVPISAFKSVLEKISPYLRPGCLVMDVCSVKTWPCRWMKQLLPQGVAALGTHPMFGPDSARYGLKGLSMVFCPVRLKSSALEEYMRFFQGKKLTAIVMTPSAHDKEAALSLALVHFIGRGLGRMKIRPQTVSTLGFGRLLAVNETVTNDSRQLFLDMHRYNPYAAKTRAEYCQALACLDRMIGQGKREASRRPRPLGRA